MSEELLVKHCSPTLAGMKTGNMFSGYFQSEKDMKECIRCWNRILTKKGLIGLLWSDEMKKTPMWVSF